MKYDISTKKRNTILEYVAEIHENMKLRHPSCKLEYVGPACVKGAYKSSNFVVSSFFQDINTRIFKEFIIKQVSKMQIQGGQNNNSIQQAKAIDLR